MRDRAGKNFVMAVKKEMSGIAGQQQDSLTGKNIKAHEWVDCGSESVPGFGLGASEAATAVPGLTHRQRVLLSILLVVLLVLVLLNLLQRCAAQHRAACMGPAVQASSQQGAEA